MRSKKTIFCLLSVLALLAVASSQVGLVLANSGRAATAPTAATVAFRFVRGKVTGFKINRKLKIDWQPIAGLRVVAKSKTSNIIYTAITDNMGA